MDHLNRLFARSITPESLPRQRSVGSILSKHPMVMHIDRGHEAHPQPEQPGASERTSRLHTVARALDVQDTQPGAQAAEPEWLLTVERSVSAYFASLAAAYARQRPMHEIDELLAASVRGLDAMCARAVKRRVADLLAAQF